MEDREINRRDKECVKFRALNREKKKKNKYRTERKKGGGGIERI